MLERETQASFIIVPVWSDWAEVGNVTKRRAAKREENLHVPWFLLWFFHFNIGVKFAILFHSATFLLRRNVMGSMTERFTIILVIINPIKYSFVPAGAARSHLSVYRTLLAFIDLSSLHTLINCFRLSIFYQHHKFFIHFTSNFFFIDFSSFSILCSRLFPCTEEIIQTKLLFFVCLQKRVHSEQWTWNIWLGWLALMGARISVWEREFLCYERKFRWAALPLCRFRGKVQLEKLKRTRRIVADRRNRARKISIYREKIAGTILREYRKIYPINGIHQQVEKSVCSFRLIFACDRRLETLSLFLALCRIFNHLYFFFTSTYLSNTSGPR